MFGRRRKGICGKSDEDVCGREEKERNMWGKLGDSRRVL